MLCGDIDTLDSKHCEGHKLLPIRTFDSQEIIVGQKKGLQLVVFIIFQLLVQSITRYASDWQKHSTGVYVRTMQLKSQLAIGMRTLCWNNFWNNRMEEESGIIVISRNARVVIGHGKLHKNLMNA